MEGWNHATIKLCSLLQEVERFYFDRAILFTIYRLIIRTIQSFYPVVPDTPHTLLTLLGFAKARFNARFLVTLLIMP